MAMRQILYISNTSRDVSDATLADILAASRRNNKACGVTGILLYIDGGFLQVLEGEDAAVAVTLARIQADNRHWNTVVLLDRDAPRVFADWSMGFERPTIAQPGIFNLTRDAIDGRLAPGAPVELLTLLRTFYRVNSPV